MIRTASRLAAWLGAACRAGRASTPRSIRANNFAYRGRVPGAPKTHTRSHRYAGEARSFDFVLSKMDSRRTWP